jgi:hypothetical protein
MKTSIKILMAAAALLVAGCTVQAQISTNVTALLPTLVGQVITYKGQNFLISTNAAGNYIVSTFGVQGTNTIVVPATPEQAEEVASQWIEANNPANIGFYGTNEIDARLGVAYVQSSGQAAAVIALDKYGLFGWQSIGLGGGFVQGQNAGKTSVGAIYSSIVYRKPIGDVAINGGAIPIGYDNFDGKFFLGLKAGLEYRQNTHLGEYLDFIVEKEFSGEINSLISGGVEYAF